jgi:hypothetical protein
MNRCQDSGGLMNSSFHQNLLLLNRSSYPFEVQSSKSSLNCVKAGYNNSRESASKKSLREKVAELLSVNSILGIRIATAEEDLSEARNSLKWAKIKSDKDRNDHARELNSVLERMKAYEQLRAKEVRGLYTEIMRLTKLLEWYTGVSKKEPGEEELLETSRFRV